MKKLLCMLLAAIMVLSLVACAAPAEPAAPTTEAAPPSEAAPTETDAATVESVNTTPLVVGYSPFSSKFSPFFASTAYDQDAVSITQIALLGLDRGGAVVEKGIQGETRAYNGTDYLYTGPADVEVTLNDDGTVYYDVTMRDDIVFSDGTPVTIDDAIFSMYVYSDPTYDGATTFFALPIEGMEEYRAGMDSRANVIIAAGKDAYEANDLFTEDQFNYYWAAFDAAGPKFAQTLVDEIIATYGEAYGVTDAAGACSLWGYDGITTVEDLWAALVDGYGCSATAIDAEMLDTSMSDILNAELGDRASEFAAGVKTGESADSITGIQKTGDYSMRLVTTEFDATTILNVGVTLAPMHYYGDAALYDYDNNMFGFPKGDLSSVRAKTTVPMGAGPYKFVKYENGVINYEANELYYKGAPATKFINFQECLADTDKTSGVATGSIDITDPSLNDSTIGSLKAANSNGEMSGDVIETNLVQNNGYGYLAMSANTVKVGEDGGSEASKNLRKGLATVLAVYRDVAIFSYYGERASVINYPISSTSWAAPSPADEGYQVAFSKKLDGSDIYTSGMTDEERYDAALAACVEYLTAAGYTFENGVAVDAPDGAKLEYEFWIPGDGIGDHPNFMVLTLARDAFAKIGINLIIKDLTNSGDLWDALDAQEVDMWSAAWGNSLDPDMYQIYYADVANAAPGSGKHPNGGPAQGGDSYRYCIADLELDELIMEGRKSPDLAYRKAVYKEALEIVIDWAVEIPSYQRMNCVIFSAERVDLGSITPDITPFWPWTSEIESIALQ